MKLPAGYLGRGCYWLEVGVDVEPVGQKCDRRLSVAPVTLIVVTDGERLAAGASEMRLDPYCSLRPRFLGLTDANAVLSSVDNDCRNGWRSRLLRMTDRGTASLYAPDHVYGEIYEHLPRLAACSRVPVQELRRHFEEEYLPALRFVTMSAEQSADSQVLAITDPDDVPLGQLAKLVAPCVVFSEDRHLRRPGLAPADWRGAAGFAVDVADGQSKQRVVGMAAVGPGWGLIELLKFISRKTSLPAWLLGLVLAGGGAYFLRKPERLRTLSEQIVPVLETLSTLIEAAMAQEQRGLAGLREVILPPPEAPTARQQVAIILARQREPLLAQQIQDLISEHFAAETVPTSVEIRGVLGDGPEFAEVGRYRWQFGRLTSPWRP